MSNVFELRSVCFDYPGGLPALADVSLCVERGERIAIVGANGSGKSTLLHLLDGLYFPTSGTVSAFGRALTEELVESPSFGPVFRKEVGFVFQNSEAQLFCPTVSDEIAFGPLQIESLTGQDVLGRVEDTLDLLDITHLRDRVPTTLSAGEKKRVALASVLAVAPSVLLLDEPTAGLDPRSQSALIDILDGLHQGGLTLIAATHDLALLPHLADRAIVLGEDHRLVADRPVDDLLADTDLLLRVNLIHEHTHRHGSIAHSHPHSHIPAHEHEHRI